MIRTAFFAALAFCSLPLVAADWQVGDDAKLAFSGSYQGEAFNGVFERFQPTIVFDAGDLAAASFQVEIDLTSAKTGVDDYDSNLQEPEFFHTRAFPKAQFATSGFRAVGDGFEADASLTIRDKTHALVFPFTFQRDGDNARLTATVTLNRLDYDVGIGDWTDTSLIANPVEVTVDLPLTRKQ